MQHPQHDAIAAAVASWYRESAPDMGYEVTRRPYGWLQRHPAVAGIAVTLAPAEPGAVPGLLAAIRADVAGRPAALRVEGREADARLGAALEAGGCVPGDAESFLAYVGDPPPATPPAGVALEDVDAATLEAWACTKLAGFAGDDASAVTTSQLRAEIAIRAAEMRGRCRLRLARVEGEPAAALACYAGEDWLLFSLATLPAFRAAGLARLMLSDALTRARDAGARSTMINADPADWPHAWYRRFGFEDEVLWRRTYRLP
jgi:GNAT superfamily N-acetyltransferase